MLDNRLAQALAQKHGLVCLNPRGTNGLWTSGRRMRLCGRSNRASVVKSIRADGGVRGVVDGSSRDIRVLHLVRDPRAVVNSQCKTFNLTRKYRRYFVDTDASPTKHGSAVDGADEVIASRPEEFETMPSSPKERAHVMGLM